jgi:hypothetical protein
VLVQDFKIVVTISFLNPKLSRAKEASIFIFVDSSLLAPSTINPLSSTKILLAPFGPIPGTLFSIFTSFEVTICANELGVKVEQIASATFGPTPFIFITVSNNFFSLLSKKPYKLCASSLIISVISRVISSEIIFELQFKDTKTSYITPPTFS